LQKLADALLERPQLKLDIPLTQAEVDREALARAALEARMPAAAGAEEDEDPAEALDARLDALEDLHDELLGESPDYPDGIDTLERNARPAARAAYLERLLIAALMSEPRSLARLAMQ